MTDEQAHVLSRSARDLDDVIKEEGRLAVDLRAAISASNLSKYRRGLGKPGADMLALIERVSEGRVKANGWGAAAGEGVAK